MGLAKKSLLADGIAPFAGSVFGAAAHGAVPVSEAAWAGTLAYSLLLGISSLLRSLSSHQSHVARSAPLACHESGLISYVLPSGLVKCGLRWIGSLALSHPLKLIC